jgi:hypothetical protein
MISYAVILAVSIVVYLFGRIVIRIIQDNGKQEQIIADQKKEAGISHKQAEIMVEAKTIEQVLSDLDTGKF